MPDENDRVQEVTAVDFSDAAKSEMQKHKDDWSSIKTSMVDWLKTNVGKNLSNTLDNANETLIADAKENIDTSKNFLSNAKTHLISLVENSEVASTIHGKPPRKDENDGIGLAIPNILGWDVEIQPQSSSGD